MSALSSRGRLDTQGGRPLPAHPTGTLPARSEPDRHLASPETTGLLTPVVLTETERRFRFRGLPQAIGAARRALREWERHFEPDHFYDLSLCVSELVTSRIQHSPEGEIELAVRRAPRVVRAEVSDAREEVGTATTQAPPTTPADWGMFIIDVVADRWGVDHSGGTLLWCEIDLTSSAP
jgi:anti-sigma regulatory factor (Ser/Thr protein kinase)